MYQPRIEFQTEKRNDVELGTTLLSAQRILDILRRQWPLISTIVCCTLFLVVIYLLAAPPIFTATSRILMDTRQTQILDKDSNVPNTLIDTGFVDSQVEILTSDDLILSVVRKMDLARDPEFIGSDTGVMHFLAKMLAYGDDGPPSQERLERNAVQTVQKNLRVERVLTTYVLSVRVQSLDAEKAAKITNALSDAYIVGALEAKYQSTRRAGEWLQQRSAELRAQATEADRAVETFKTQNNIVGTSRGLMSEQQLTDVNTQLIQARAATAEAKARLDRIQSISDKDLAQPTVTDALNNTVITRLRAQYLDLATQYADLSTRYGKTHQAAINLANRMEDLRKAIADEVKRIADSYRSEFEIAKSRQESIETNMNTLVNQAGNNGQANVKLRNLESTSDTYRNLYNNFLEQLQQANQKQSFPISEARIISTAVKPDKKSSPKSVLFLVGGVLGGLCLGIGAAFSRELLNDVLRSPSEVEDELGVKCLGTLPQIGSAKAVGTKPGPSAALGNAPPPPHENPAMTRYVVDHPFSRFAETLRNVKVSIDVACLTREVRVIGIVSSLPKEGKTTAAANLAQLTALIGHRTLLIDGDLHTRSLTRELAPHAKTGFLETLRNPRDFSRHIQHSKETGLDFMASCVESRMINSADIMASKAMDTMLAVLREHYDYIFIDVAPILPVTDAKAFSHLMDGLIYVIEWGQTKRSAIQEAISSSETIQKRIIGAVLNRANPKMLKRIEAYKGAHHNSYYVEGD